MLHAIHTTADFDMEKYPTDRRSRGGFPLRKIQPGGGAHHHHRSSGRLLPASHRGLAAYWDRGEMLFCKTSAPYSTARKRDHSPRAGIGLPYGTSPALYMYSGSAPGRVKMELCDLIRKGKAIPAGIIAAPVGFVHVQESKHMVKPFVSIPKLIIEGRKGGSNLAATLVNAILCYNDAKQLKPGRDV
ncbi:MAG: precorrin-8X methylmutase [Parabacteroides merdae]